MSQAVGGGSLWPTACGRNAPPLTPMAFRGFLRRGHSMRTDAADEFPPLLLTEGGPGHALLRRLRLAPLGRSSPRTALVLAAVTWIPLLALSVIEGVAVTGPQVPFAYDLAAHVRLLVALPVLVLAEIPIGFRLRETAAHFISAGLVGREEYASYVRIIEDTRRFRDSRVAELVLLGAAYVTTYTVLTHAAFQAGSTWHTPQPHAGLTLAGYWYALVSVPIFQFVLYRWIYRMLAWARFLRQMSKLRLQLTPTHPDGAGGLGFLGKGCIPFGILLFATGAVVSSAIATSVLFGDSALQDYYLSYAALVVFALVVFAGPLLVFVPMLSGLKHQGLLDYGVLASRYAQLFDRKWVKRAEVPDEPLLGTADVGSLADLGSSYALIEKMRPLPIRVTDFAAMAIPGLIPAIPLAATVMPIGDIVIKLLHLLT